MKPSNEQVGKAWRIFRQITSTLPLVAFTEWEDVDSTVQIIAQALADESATPEPSNRRPGVDL